MREDEKKTNQLIKATLNKNSNISKVQKAASNVNTIRKANTKITQQTEYSRIWKRS